MTENTKCQTMNNNNGELQTMENDNRQLGIGSSLFMTTKMGVPGSLFMKVILLIFERFFVHCNN